LEGQGNQVYGGSDGEEKGHERKGIDPHTNGDTGTDEQTKPAPLGRHKWSVSSFGSQVVPDPGGIPEWKSQVKPIMHHFAERTPGVILEEGDATLTWHYTDADTVFGRFQARDLQKQLESFLLQHLSIEVVSEEGSSRYHTRWVKVRPSGVDKSLVIERALEWIRDEAGGYGSSVLPGNGLSSGTTSRSGSHGSLSGSVGAIHRVSPGILESGSAGNLSKRPCLGDHGPVVDFVFCAGDDRADEGMFDLFGDDFKLAQLGLGPIKARIFTCRVGTGATSAATILESPQKLIELLEELCSEEPDGFFEEKPSLFSFQSSTGSLSKMAGNPGSW
jgi:trehalose-6-phosphatase